MDAHLVELSRAIDPVDLGRRIRVARKAAGMTQALLAGGEVSAAYISRIEDGQRRPDVALLERLASRMGTSAHQLLTGMTSHEARDLELEIEHAAIAAGLGDAATALRRSTEVVERVRDYGDDQLIAYGLRVQATAYHLTGNVDEAIAILEEVVDQPVADVNTLRALILLCHCHFDRNHLRRAIAAGEAAQRMIRDLGIYGLTETVQLAAIMAEAHHRRGASRTASRISREALDSTTSRSSQTAQAMAYWHASLAEASSNGATPAAIELAKAALALIDLEAGRCSAEALTRIALS